MSEWTRAWPELVIGLVGAGLVSTAAAIAVWQRRARSCPLHQRRVGWAAWVVAGFAAILGASLLGYAVMALARGSVGRIVER